MMGMSILMVPVVHQMTLRRHIVGAPMMKYETTSPGIVGSLIKKR